MVSVFFVQLGLDFKKNAVLPSDTVELSRMGLINQIYSNPVFI